MNLGTVTIFKVAWYWQTQLKTACGSKIAKRSAGKTLKLLEDNFYTFVCKS